MVAGADAEIMGGRGDNSFRADVFRLLGGWPGQISTTKGGSAATAGSGKEPLLCASVVSFGRTGSDA
jgi:hypothetical protein